MSKRSYRQHCGLAAALDVVGQRWSLLIIRDLVPGPRRFTDLFEGLPGISTDLLADRLRSLEAAGAVRHREVRNPAPAKLYELTDRGLELAKVVGDLARWGGPLLPDLADADDHNENARWMLTYRAGRHRGGLSNGDMHILLDDADELTLSVRDGRARLQYGHTAADPVVTLATSTASILAVLRTSPDQAVAIPDDFAARGNEHLAASILQSL